MTSPDLDGMSNLRPLAALALVALTGAGCGANARVRDRHRRSQPAPPPRQRRQEADRPGQGGEVRRVHPRARRHATSRTRTRTNDFEYGVSVEPRRCGSRPPRACKDLQPPGTLARKRTPKQQSASLRFAQCIREQRREGLPGPRQRRAADRHEQDPVLQPARRHDDPQRRDRRSAATSCSWQPGARSDARELGAGRGGRRWSSAASAAWSRCPAASDRAAAARRRRRTPRRCERGALGHGLPGRDPDLPGAAGRLAVRRDQPGPRRSTPSCPRRATRSAAAACSTGWTTSRCCCCAARSRPTASCTSATPAGTSASSTANLHVRGAGDAFTARDDARRSRRSSARKGLHVTGALALDDAVFLPEPVRIAKVTGQLGGARPAGRAGAERHVRHAARAGGPRPVAAGRGQAGRPRPDHAAGQHAGDGKGRGVRTRRAGPGRAGRQAPPTRPSRPSSASTTRRRRAGSTRPRSRWTSPPRAWTTP